MKRKFSQKNHNILKEEEENRNFMYWTSSIFIKLHIFFLFSGKMEYYIVTASMKARKVLFFEKYFINLTMTIGYLKCRLTEI